MTDINKELLPCPFCNGHAYLEPAIDGYETTRGYDAAARIRCSECFISTAEGEQNDLIKDWNTRTTPSVNQELLEALQGGNDNEEGRVKIPTSADEAEGMAKMGWLYLKEHAPERLESDLRAKQAISKANATQPSVNQELLAVLKELEESSSYWGEYDVPLGIHDRIKQAIANAQAQQDDAWLKDAVIVLEEGAEPMVGDLCRYEERDSDGESSGDYEYAEYGNAYPLNDRFVDIIQRNGKPVVYRPKAQQVKEGE